VGMTLYLIRLTFDIITPTLQEFKLL